MPTSPKSILDALTGQLSVHEADVDLVDADGDGSLDLVLSLRLGISLDPRKLIKTLLGKS